MDIGLGGENINWASYKLLRFDKLLNPKKHLKMHLKNEINYLIQIHL